MKLIGAKMLWGALWLLAPLAQAQNYPTRPVRIIVPFVPAGPTDINARMVAQKLTEAWGVSFVVENRGGAGGVLGTAKVAEAAADGRTMIMATLGSQVLSPATREARSIPYDPVNALEPVMLIGSVPSLLVARPGMPAGLTLRELIASARKAESEKKPLTFASAGSGSTMHVGMELLKSAAGVDITHIQYRGAGPALVDLLGNHVDMLVADVNVLAPRLASGIRAVALLGPERHALAKDVPKIGRAHV